jgi:HAD superfamily hydrolase (TIGR01509 family)
MNPLKALIFDVDGTLADTESAHLQAFNSAFAESKLDWHWSVPEYTELLKVSGGKERIAHYWRDHPPDLRFIDGHSMITFIEQLHLEKTIVYEALVSQGAVRMREGVLDLIHEARREGLTLAIATTTSPVNIAALLQKAIGSDWQSYFSVVEDASTAPQKKPHPQVYLQTLKRLDLPADSCLAIEDSENGLQAALAAKLRTVITTNSFTGHHDFSGALQVLPNLSGIQVEHLRHWQSQAPMLSI